MTTIGMINTEKMMITVPTNMHESLPGNCTFGNSDFSDVFIKRGRISLGYA